MTDLLLIHSKIALYFITKTNYSFFIKKRLTVLYQVTGNNVQLNALTYTLLEQHIISVVQSGP